VHRAAKITVGVTCAAMLSVAGYGVHNIIGALTGDPGATSPAAADAANAGAPLTASGESPTAEQAQQAAKAFLDAWATGDAGATADLTDDPATARQALTAYHADLHVAKLAVATSTAAAPATRGTPAPGALPVAFQADAQLTGFGDWTYQGAVSVIKTTNGKAVVHWAPSVLHPRLTDQTALKAGALPALPARITDRTGTAISAYPSLAALAPGFQTALDTLPEGPRGKGVVITGKESGRTLATLHTFSPSKAARTLKLTIDGRLQAAAEKAVAEQGESGSRTASLVAVEPSTGHVLALANSRPGFNSAFLGQTAPGSTMKIITSAALLERGVSPSASAPCAAKLYVYGKEFHNEEGSSNPGATLRDDFTASCNTGFIGLRGKLGAGDLAAEARDVFGIGMEWHTGLPNVDGKVPVADGDEVEKAADMIGQGSVQMNPLAMASVSATVRSGVFRQPLIVPGLRQPAAARPLAAITAARLRGLMRATAVRGTAAKVMSGLGGVMGAKTGTAEVGSTTDSWFTAYAGDVAAAAMVEGGGHGADAAGPAVRAVLDAGR
jgi:hypothetical protein